MFLKELTQTRVSLEEVLKRLFSKPGVVVIAGKGKVGKTDFALKLSEFLLNLKLHTQPKEVFLINSKEDVASNINTNGYYQQIVDLITLKRWLYSNNHRKLYIFDEATQHLFSRQAMSQRNVGFIKLLPQITKAHARMIVIGHSLTEIDKQLLNEAWCYGIFVKLDLKTAKLISNFYDSPIVFRNISRTSVPFDPYEVAPFYDAPPNVPKFKDEDLALLWRWANGESYKSLGLHPMQLHRKLQKFVKENLENASHLSQA